MSLNTISHRICPKCKEPKEDDDFYTGTNKYYCKNCVKAVVRLWQKANPEKHRAAGRKYKFDISAVEYDQLLVKQGNCCAICFNACSSGRALAIDHDHKTGKIRGLLCGNCNRGLGNFKDDIESLQEAIEYLRRAK